MGYQHYYPLLIINSLTEKEGNVTTHLYMAINETSRMLLVYHFKSMNTEQHINTTVNKLTCIAAEMVSIKIILTYFTD